MRQVICFSMAIVVMSAALPTFAFDSDMAPPAITEEERAMKEAKSGKKIFPLGATVSFGQSVGGGTFVADPNVRRPYYDMSLVLAPFFRITPLMRVLLKVGITQSVVENYDSVVTRKYRTLLSDTAIAFKHMRLYQIPKLKINIGATASATLPTSLQSQYRDLIVSGAGALSFTRVVGPVYMGYSVTMFKNFNRYHVATMNINKVGEHVVLSHFNGNSQLTSDLVTAGTANVSFGVVNTGVVSWNITGKLSLAAQFEINNSWTYDSFEKDDLSSEHAVSGRGQRDVMRGILDVSYQFTTMFSASIGTDTLIAPKTADNDAFIFPFANFSKNYRNNSSVYLAFTGVF